MTHGYYKEIDKAAESQGVAVKWSPGLLLIFTILLAILIGPLALPVIGLFAQGTLNKYWDEIQKTLPRRKMFYRNDIIFVAIVWIILFLIGVLVDVG